MVKLVDRKSKICPANCRIAPENPVQEPESCSCECIYPLISISRTMDTTTLSLDVAGMWVAQTCLSVWGGNTRALVTTNQAHQQKNRKNKRRKRNDHTTRRRTRICSPYRPSGHTNLRVLLLAADIATEVELCLICGAEAGHIGTVRYWGECSRHSANPRGHCAGFFSRLAARLTRPRMIT